MSTDNQKGQPHHFAHHFSSASHEHETSKQGVWVFLVTEIMMFGGLFVAYGIFRNMHPDIWHAGSKLLNVALGGLNTLVLITSSFTMALAVHYTQKGQNKKAFPQLILTFLCAATFLVVKYFEYSHKFHEGLLPGAHFHYPEGPEHLALFFGVYFMMTGLHGIHILIGMGLMVWLMIRNRRGDFNSEYFTPVENVGLYWHIVDIIWIYLFPLLYLIG